MCMESKICNEAMRSLQLLILFLSHLRPSRLDSYRRGRVLIMQIITSWHKALQAGQCVNIHGHGAQSQFSAARYPFRHPNLYSERPSEKSIARTYDIMAARKLAGECKEESICLCGHFHILILNHTSSLQLRSIGRSRRSQRVYKNSRRSTTSYRVHRHHRNRQSMNLS